MPDLTLYLCRHGDTAWSAERRLAGRTDIPLVEHGEQNARQLGQRLAGLSFDRVLVSPLGRARHTAELAGFGARAEVDERLLEMAFGVYEGRTVQEIRRERPGWTYLREGCPEGEGPAEIGQRADALLDELTPAGGRVVLFGHSIILRVMTARFLGLPPGGGRMLMMSPGAVSVLGYDPVDDSRAIAAWNDRHHLSGQVGFA
ncbi:MAG TPA: histidine phosphatase family protein [Polyangiaceae bacterium]|nr:histidine phosphatase family protein [Polyangiaceae bacterium]